LHTQPLELPWLRELIRAQFSDGAYPQLVLRLGAVIQQESSVRRSHRSALVHAAAST
jgi:hypothetical protein